MASQRPTGTRASGLRSRGDRSSVAAAGASAAESGSATSTRAAPSPKTPPATAPSAERTTRATYRLLVLRGLAPDEASNVTAYLCGIHVGTQRWKLSEVNRLLFLRSLVRGGSFGAADGMITGHRVH